MHRTLPGLASRVVGLVAATLMAAAAAAAPKAYVGNFKDNTVSVIDTGTGSVVATVPVSAGPDGVVVGRDDKRAYVSASNAATIDVLDTASDRVVGHIDVGQGPQGLAVSADGRWLFAAVNGADLVAIIDTQSQTVVATVPVVKPHTVAIRPGQTEAWVSSQEPGHFSVVVIDLAKRAVAATIPLEKTPRDLEFSHDGKALYLTLAGVSAVQVLDPETRRTVAQVATGVSPHIAHHFAGQATGVAVVQGPGELLMFDPQSLAAVRHIPVGKQPHWVDVLPGGKSVIVTNEGSNDVSVVDLAAGTNTTIAVGTAPRKVAVQHGGGGTSATAATTTTTATAPATVNVSINNFAFDPREVSVLVGQTVRWLNEDGAPHGVAVSDGGPGMDMMLPGQAFSRKFDKPGVYDIHCPLHAYMTSKLRVKAP